MTRVEVVRQNFSDKIIALELNPTQSHALEVVRRLNESEKAGFLSAFTNGDHNDEVKRKLLKVLRLFALEPINTDLATRFLGRQIGLACFVLSKEGSFYVDCQSRLKRVEDINFFLFLATDDPKRDHLNFLDELKSDPKACSSDMFSHLITKLALIWQEARAEHRAKLMPVIAVYNLNGIGQGFGSKRIFLPKDFRKRSDLILGIYPINTDIFPK